MPANVDGAGSVPGGYHHSGTEIEVFEGDWVFEGEANHHRNNRGWTYYCGTLRNGKFTLKSKSAFAAPAVKEFLRERGERELLRGAGDVAAIVRYAHAVRLGYREWSTAKKAETTNPEPRS